MRLFVAALCVYLSASAFMYSSQSDCLRANSKSLSVYDLVAFGSGGDKVYLATLYGSHNPGVWRLRTILLPPDVQTCKPNALSLATSGTKMLVSCSEGPQKSPFLIDLTAPVVSKNPLQHQHRLASVSSTPVLLFRRALQNGTQKGIAVYRLELLEVTVSPNGENGPSDLEPSFTLPGATHAIQLASGKVAYVTESGAIRIRGLNGNDSEVGNLTSPKGDEVVLVATGAEGADSDGFVLTTGDRAYAYTTDGSTDGTRHVAINGGLFEILMTLQDKRKPPDLDKPPEYCGDKKSQLKNIVCLDKRQSVDDGIEWEGIALVQPTHELYAPVLEFAQEETVYPSSVKIWGASPDQLCADVPEDELGDCLYKRWYLPRHRQPWEGSVVYYQELSCRGTWLFEYWTYYPFDVGGVKGHMHDSEHVFVEVDKLGGRPDAVLGAAHTFLTPNNIYSRIGRPGASPILLPIVVMVELGKHATAPDINQDGHFTPGIDTNVNVEQAQVWGIRDAIGISDSHVTKYEASMTVPRREEDHLYPPGFERIYPKAEGNPRPEHNGRQYKLKHFPCSPAAPCDKPETRPTGDCAKTFLNSNGDNRNPRAIYKAYIFPAWGIRAGYSGSSAGRGGSVGGVVSLFELTKLLRTSMAIPGRLALDFQFQSGLPSGQLVETGEVRHAFTGGVTYERLFTNMFGGYGGVLFRVHRTSQGLHYGGEWYRVGPMFEIPTPKGGITVQYGPLLSSRLGKTVTGELRVTWYPRFWQNRFRIGRWQPFRKPIKEY